ncbi:MAG: relaxase domain-containing protein [Silvanigrellaceae bacterium]|nr:relaxase domain-containing protein [Silvanigrellaceae bacterium]
MLSVENVSLSIGRNYYQKDNYYTKQEAEEHSRWFGKSALELGLSGKVEFSQFDNLLFGFSPDGKSALATNAVDPKKYEEPHLTKTEKGTLEFTVRKISEKYGLDLESMNKISKILDHHTRFQKKVKIKEKNECITSIENVLKSFGLKGNKREEAVQLYSEAINKVTREKERRGGYDLTFSAPKSISVLALVHKDKEVLQAHRDAVLTALTVIEKDYAKTRVGDNTQREIENVKKLIIATFEHDTSRELDPQLHTHCVVMNLIHREDGEWRSLHADDFRNFSKYFGMVYQNELAHRVQKLGYEIEVNENGTFDVKGVPKDLLLHFSKRREQMVKELGVTDQKSARNLVKVDRAKKKEGVVKADEEKRWAKEDSEFKYDRKFIYDRKFRIDKNKSEINYTNDFKIKKMDESIQDAFTHASERQVLFSIESAKMNHIQNNFGKYSHFELMDPLDKKISEQLVAIPVQMGTKYLTKESIEIEEQTAKILQKEGVFKRISTPENIKTLLAEKNSYSIEKKNEILSEIDNILKDQDFINKEKISIYLNDAISDKHRLSSFQLKNIIENMSEILDSSGLKKTEKNLILTDLIASVSKCSGLNQGQKNAIEETLLSEDRHLIWEGVAGAGKTYSLKTVIEEAKKSGYEVRGFAQNGDAAAILSNETGIKAQTIASLVISKQENTPHTNKDKIWIIDESGLIDAKLGLELSKRADVENARMIIVGGISQLSAPSSGHFLKFVCRYTNIKKLKLNESVRQKNKDLALGVQYLNSFDLQKLDSIYYKIQLKSLRKKRYINLEIQLKSLKQMKAELRMQLNIFFL